MLNVKHKYSGQLGRLSRGHWEAISIEKSLIRNLPKNGRESEGLEKGQEKSYL